MAYSMNKEYKIIDLTHSLSSDIPSWDDGSSFELSISTDYTDCAPPHLFRMQKIKSSASMGTHMDSPSHVIPGGRTIDQLNLEELVVDCVVVDVSQQVDENYLVMPEVLEKFEKQYGKIQAASFVIFYTGWDKRWHKPAEYRNNYKFPSVDISTAEILVQRNIAGLGTDTLSSDTGQAGFPARRAILGANKYLVENIANANLLPPTGSKIFILPTKIKNATEAPVRLIALI